MFDINRRGKPLAQAWVRSQPLPDRPHPPDHRRAAGFSERNGGASSDGMVICIMATGGMSIPNCNAGRSFGPPRQRGVGGHLEVSLRHPSLLGSKPGRQLAGC